MGRSLAEKINRLFATIRPEGREWTNQDVERWLAEHAARDGDGLTISAAYLWLLRNGQRDNPRMSHLQAMAKFFGVDPGYFVRDDEQTEQVYDDLALLGLLRDHQIQAIAMRAADLDPAMRTWLANTIAQLPNGTGTRERPASHRPAPS